MATKLITVGRRKTASARCLLSSGSGKITINKKDGKVFFIPSQYDLAILPFKVTDTLGKYDAVINVFGGGFTGQIGAIQLAISRALMRENPEFKVALKTKNLLTRDPRMVERKKYGQPKARKKFQFSKR
jgi:small subunit ribosomal protein S9